MFTRKGKTAIGERKRSDHERCDYSHDVEVKAAGRARSLRRPKMAELEAATTRDASEMAEAWSEGTRGYVH